MRRRTFDALLTTGGVVVAAILIIAGALLTWGSSFANSNVHSQLASQKVFFPPKGSPALTAAPEIAKYVTPYAGQQVVNGAQAEVYADHFIKVHLREIGQGQTYSQVSETFLSMKPTDPNYQKVATERATLFQGETLRGLLLDAYAFGKIGQIAGVAAVVSFVAAGVLLLLSALGFWHLRRVSPGVEVLPRLGARTPAPVEL